MGARSARPSACSRCVLVRVKMLAQRLERRLPWRESESLRWHSCLWRSSCGSTLRPRPHRCRGRATASSTRSPSAWPSRTRARTSTCTTRRWASGSRSCASRRSTRWSRTRSACCTSRPTRCRAATAATAAAPPPPLRRLGRSAPSLRLLCAFSAPLHARLVPVPASSACATSSTPPHPRTPAPRHQTISTDELVAAAAEQYSMKPDESNPNPNPSFDPSPNPNPHPNQV